MSKYTTEVRFICETAYGLSESQGCDSVDTIIEGALDKVFNFDFPIFDETYRRVLEKKILKHFYTREIGEETVGLWKLRLNTRLNEIMPYYNQLYKSELIQFNPMYEIDYTKTSKMDTVGSVKDDNSETSNRDMTGNTNGSSNSNSLNKYSDTPQGAVTDLVEGRYLTNATQDTNNTSQNTNERENVKLDTKTRNDRNIKNTDDYIEHVVGKNSGVSYSDLLLKFRETFLNIDMLVIRDLENLFFQLW